MTKNVFSKEKFYATLTKDEKEDLKSLEQFNKQYSWAVEYDGKTMEECKKMGYSMYLS